MTSMNSPVRKILKQASTRLKNLEGEYLEIITVAKPSNIEQAIYLAKTISKLSPFLSNVIEHRIVEILNQAGVGFSGYWKSQEPTFPDAIFSYWRVQPIVVWIFQIVLLRGETAAKTALSYIVKG